MNSQTAVDNCHARVNQLRLQLSHLKYIDHRQEEAAQLATDLQNAEAEFETRSLDKLLAENAIISQVPELFEGKLRKTPTLLRHRSSRAESTLRIEVQADDVVETVDTSTTPYETLDLPPVLDPGDDPPDAWTPFDDGAWAAERAPAAADDWLLDPVCDVYRTRSFLSPVAEMTDESSSPPSPPAPAPRTFALSPPPFEHEDLAFPEPIADLAATLYVPSGLVPPLQLIPAFSFETLPLSAAGLGLEGCSAIGRGEDGSGQGREADLQGNGLGSAAWASALPVVGTRDGRDSANSMGEQENRPFGVDERLGRRDTQDITPPMPVSVGRGEGPRCGQAPKADYHGIRFWNWQKTGTLEH